MVELVSLVLETLLTKDDTPVLAESCLFLGYYVLCLGSQSIQDDPEHHLACMAQTDGPVVLAQLEVAFLRKHNDQRLRPWSWPLTRILLQTMVNMSTTDSPPCFNSSAGMLSTAADFPIFRDLTAASTSSRSFG